MSEFDYNKITAEVITDLAKSSAKAVWDKITQTYKDISNKGDIDYGMAFEKYLTESEKHISMAKTILYGQIPHHLYSFFECMVSATLGEIIRTITGVATIYGLTAEFIECKNDFVISWLSNGSCSPGQRVLCGCEHQVHNKYPSRNPSRYARK